jgi:hypothetical protein
VVVPCSTTDIYLRVLVDAHRCGRLTSLSLTGRRVVNVSCSRNPALCSDKTYRRSTCVQDREIVRPCAARRRGRVPACRRLRGGTGRAENDAANEPCVGRRVTARWRDTFGRLHLSVGRGQDVQSWRETFLEPTEMRVSVRIREYIRHLSDTINNHQPRSIF